MKPIHKSILLLLTVFTICHTALAQWCTGVNVQVYGANPQAGPVNIWGVSASIPAEYIEDITVSGYMYNPDDPGNNHPFSITIYKGTTEASTGLFFQTGPFHNGEVSIESINPCPEVTAYYAGVYIIYESANGLLKFNSSNDFNTVVDALDANYESWNQYYENQYPNLTADELDDMDDVTGFDEFQENRQFEQLFAGYYSKRQHIEDVEAEWLNTELVSTNPDVFDLTADDAVNTILSSNGSFKVGNDQYDLNDIGLYINGNIVASSGLRLKTKEQLAAAEAATDAFYGNIGALDRIGLAGPSMIAYEDEEERLHPGCRSNRKVIDERVIGEEMYKLKVAINSLGVRSSVKTKIIHYKRKRGKYKRARAKLAVYIAAKVYDNDCVFQQDMSERHPSGGWKNRKQLKLVERGWGTFWRTKNSEVNGSFEQDNGNHYSAVISW